MNSYGNFHVSIFFLQKFFQSLLKKKIKIKTKIKITFFQICLFKNTNKYTFVVIETCHKNMETNKMKNKLFKTDIGCKKLCQLKVRLKVIELRIK